MKRLFQKSGGEAEKEYILVIERRRDGETRARLQRFRYRAESAGDTVATALLWLNSRSDLRDADGHSADPVKWDCSCLQKKCGACAMLVNGIPRLACDSSLSGLPETIHLAPLRKFPLVADLMADRSVMQKNLRDMQVWLQEPARLNEAVTEDVYQASRCLQCGLCLEVCPNFDPEGGFTGAAAAVAASRILAADAPENRGGAHRGIREKWTGKVFEGCGKSLSCQNICPAGIRTGEMLAQSNAVVLWGRRHRRQMTEI